MKILKNKKILDIREATPQDAEEILDVLKTIGGETDFLLIDREGLPTSLEAERAVLEANLQRLNNKVFIGLVDGKIVATSGITGSERDRIKHNVSLGLSILKDYWNIGIGTHMVEYIVNYCRMTKQIKNITLEVREGNTWAIKLYEDAGFKKVGTYSGRVLIDGDYKNELIYELVL